MNYWIGMSGKPFENHAPTKNHRGIANPLRFEVVRQVWLAHETLYLNPIKIE